MAINKKILIVEDDNDLMELMKMKLTTEGFKVIKAQTGQEALDQLKNNPDLVLLDILLPDIDGLTVLNEIARNPEHYKPLMHDLAGERRVHIMKSFVLKFIIDENTKTVTFFFFGHHDDAYKR